METKYLDYIFTTAYHFPDRNLEDCEEWQNLLQKCSCDDDGICSDELHKNILNGYENDVFVIIPYYWGDDEDIIILPNFIYKPTGFALRWYKRPFRSTYMSQNLTSEELKQMWTDCAKSIIDTAPENK